MAKNRDLPADQKGRSIRNPVRSMKEDWQGSFLLKLFPFICMLYPVSQSDPVIGIGLPRAEPLQDTAMISAYYLSFYE